MRSLAIQLLKLYPPAWRARYGEELAAVIEMSSVTPFVLLDVLRGALDAHLHPELVPEGGSPMPTRLRSAEIAVFAAWIAFVLAGMGFQKMTEYDDFQAAGRAHPLLGVSFTLVEAGAAIALLAVLAGGLPIAYAALRHALAAQRRDILALFCVPPLAFVVLVVYGFVALRIPVAAAQGGQPSAAGKALFLGLVALVALGAVASVWAVGEAIRRSDVSARLFRFAFVPAIVAAVAMVLMCGAALVWGLGLRASDPALFGGDDGIVGTSTTLSWIVIVVVMAVATAVAVAAVLRGFGARSSVRAA